MIIIGVSLGFNSSASVWHNNRCIASLSQERLSGIKNTKEIPLDAIYECFKICTNSVDIYEERICLAYSHYEQLTSQYIFKNLSDLSGLPEGDDSLPNDPEVWLKELVEKKINTSIDSVVRVEHHTAHKYSAYAVYGKSKKKHTVLTMDGFGDGYSARMSIVDGDNIDVIKSLPLVKSPALYYQFVTGALGFKEHQHEGKVTGLATGRYIQIDKYVDDIVKFFNDLWHERIPLCELNDDEKHEVEKSSIIDFDDFLKLKKTIYGFVKSKLPKDYSVDNILKCKEAIALATAVQIFTQSIIFEFFPKEREDYTDEIYLAGGMFANVAVNRMFGTKYKHVYISPAMGDEGTAMGAAAYIADISYGISDEFHPEYIISAGVDIKSAPIKDIFIVNDLMDSDDKIVHLCSGRSEFGPRALMHRSSLFPATTDRETIALNAAMHRSEFMPYAPVCREEDVDELFINWEPFEKSLHFMTVALFVRSGVSEKYPAAVHRDGTCRVQVVHKDVPCERTAWNILSLYKELSGNAVLINTSFNIHNEPTCCTKQQCNSAWVRSGKLGKVYYKMEDEE